MAKDFKELIADYIVFIIIVFITSFVPLWSRLFGKKKTRTKADYVFATGAVSVFSMMMSIARGTLGVRSFLGNFPMLSVSRDALNSSFNRFSQRDLLSRRRHVGDFVRHGERISDRHLCVHSRLL